MLIKTWTFHKDLMHQYIKYEEIDEKSEEGREMIKNWISWFLRCVWKKISNGIYGIWFKLILHI